jgi:hypothetical protein
VLLVVYVCVWFCLVVLLKLVAFALRAIATNRRNVDHAVAEFDERAACQTSAQSVKCAVPFDGNVNVSEIVQREVEEFLQAIFSKEVLD